MTAPLTDEELAALDFDASDESGMAGIPRYAHVRRAVAEIRASRSARAAAAGVVLSEEGCKPLAASFDVPHDRIAAACISFVDAADGVPRSRIAPPRWRPEVVAFADAMEAKLKENDWKGGWQDDHPDDLMVRLREESKELTSAVRVVMKAPIGKDADALASAQHTLIREAADVGNFAMMVADVCGALARPTDASFGVEAGRAGVLAPLGVPVGADAGSDLLGDLAVRRTGVAAVGREVREHLASVAGADAEGVTGQPVLGLGDGHGPVKGLGGDEGVDGRLVVAHHQSNRPPDANPETENGTARPADAAGPSGAGVVKDGAPMENDSCALWDARAAVGLQVSRAEPGSLEHARWQRSWDVVDRLFLAGQRAAPVAPRVVTADEVRRTAVVFGEGSDLRRAETLLRAALEHLGITVAAAKEPTP